MKAVEYLKQVLTERLKQLDWPVDDQVEVEIEKTRDARFGDLATNLAMNLASLLKQSPRQIADQILAGLSFDSNIIERTEIAGAGFINFFLSPEYLRNEIIEILQAGTEFGRSNIGKGKKLQVEFVSANPTGPLNVVSARAATIGDVMVNIFNTVGFDAKREYYVNDAGRQVQLLGESVGSRYCQLLGIEEPFPEEGYYGEYVVELAKEILNQYGKQFTQLDRGTRNQKLATIALEKILRSQKEQLEQFGVYYDVWFRESELRRNKAEQQVLRYFAEKNLTYEKDGALWFKSSQFGDEKDRVLITKHGELTYFAVDIAYHKNKYDRGFEIVYDLWGPDHHGYIARMRAAILALGLPREAFEVKIIQQVNLLRDGEVIKMSKRAGQIVEMAELIDEVGVDAARFFFLMRRISAPLDFDIELAKKQSEDNPVYYLQYAHARICNILKFATQRATNVEDLLPVVEQVSQKSVSKLLNRVNLKLLQAPEELELIKNMIEYPNCLIQIARSFEPHLLTQYLQNLAGVFHKFYHNHRVVTDDVELTKARLCLVAAARIVFANGLRIMGVSAPKEM